MAGLRQAQINPLQTFANAEDKGHAESRPRFAKRSAPRLLKRKVSAKVTRFEQSEAGFTGIKLWHFLLLIGQILIEALSILKIVAPQAWFFSAINIEVANVDDLSSANVKCARKGRAFFKQHFSASFGYPNMTTDSYNHAGQLQDSSCVSAGQATGAVRIN